MRPLWRPVGPAELKLIQNNGMLAFPERLPQQPIFYPVLSEEYATKIARDWNVPADGSGFVTRFRVRRDFMERYTPHEAGGRAHLEYWIPSEELAAFNDAIVAGPEVCPKSPTGQGADRSRSPVSGGRPHPRTEVPASVGGVALLSRCQAAPYLPSTLL
jgi:hypothetical protein